MSPTKQYKFYHPINLTWHFQIKHKTNCRYLKPKLENERTEELQRPECISGILEASGIVYFLCFWCLVELKLPCKQEMDAQAYLEMPARMVQVCPTCRELCSLSTEMSASKALESIQGSSCAHYFDPVKQKYWWLHGTKKKWILLIKSVKVIKQQSQQQSKGEDLISNIIVY